jgi:hypothetical protein
MEMEVTGESDSNKTLVSVVRAVDTDDRLNASSQIWLSSFEALLASSFQQLLLSELLFMPMSLK